MVMNKNLLLSKNRRVDKKTKLLVVATQYYYKKNIFNLIQMMTYNIILGMPWLNKHNLIINYEKKTIKFQKCNYVVTTHFIY